MQALNPLTMPLVDNNLIEASAGTGKTYTITTLYLRALLGSQHDLQHSEHNAPMSVEQILVVTFTEAATEEIRDRVRAKLIEAKQALFYLDCDDDNKPKADGILVDIISQIADKTLAFERLDGAIKMMDEAAIFTIHGFCQRMLKYHAFESGSLFDNEFIVDEQQYLLTAIKDFWRCTVYPLSGAMLQLFLRQWRSPESLLSEIRPLLNKQASLFEPQIDKTRLEKTVAEYQILVTKVKEDWIAEQIPALIAESNMIKSRKPAKADYLQAFTDFCLSDGLAFKKGADSWELWSVASITKATKKGAQPPTHRIFNDFERLAQIGQSIGDEVKAYFKIAALQVVQSNLALAKAQAQKLSPDDLLTKMAAALADKGNGERLAQRISQQYPLAMIDEFQDTDPLQYQIFSTIYHHSDTSLIMIGDPKQAIYGFRGADIFTYIAAKQAVGEQQQYTLDRNWRSSKALITGVNGLFSHKESAFIYAEAIPFNPVKAADKVADQPLLIAEDNGAALQIWQLSSEDNLPVKKSDAIEQLALHSSNEIVSILTKAQAGKATIGKVPLQAGDICILVRDRNEAQVMRDALSAAGVSSVFLSRQSVFETPLAIDFYILLQAIYQQNNDKAIRASLITCFFNININDLWQLTENEEAWQQVLSDFTALNQLWSRHGVMAVLQHLLVEQDLACQWRTNQAYPERMLTDIRHLGELLQQKSMELDGVHRLLNWYQQQLVNAQDQDKVQQLRLEDDSNLVQIVTMHASKGLEYPIVFMPFACHYRPTKSAIYHNDNNKLVIDFSDKEDNLVKADQERLAEDLRLLYVALTRGVHRCYIGISNLKHGNAKKSILANTSLGYLLFEGDNFADNEISSQLHQLADKLNQQCDNCCAVTVFGDVQSRQVFSPQDEVNSQYHLAQFTGIIEQDWKITSYSALCYGVANVHVLPGSTDEGANTPVLETVIDANWDRFSFPKGANAGSCLHQILEDVPFAHFATKQINAADEAKIIESFRKYGIDELWLQPVIQWLSDVVNCAWNRTGLSLATLKPNDCLIEMEFYLSMSRIKAYQINRILSLHLGRKVNDFEFNQVQGLLKGFIDLTVCYKGKYYVVDYKSNHLGDASVNYLDDALEVVMDSHHYHLQYLLYSLALHRFLVQRLKGYDYDSHFGGCYYLFLRGMSAQNLDFNGIYFSKPKRKVIEQLDDLFAGNKGHEAKDSDEIISPEQLGLFGE